MKYQKLPCASFLSILLLTSATESSHSRTSSFDFSNQPTQCPPNSPPLLVINVAGTPETIEEIFTPRTLDALSSHKSPDDLAALAERQRRITVAKKVDGTVVAAVLAGSSSWVDAVAVNPSEEKASRALERIFRNIRNTGRPIELRVAVKNNSDLNQKLLSGMRAQGFKSQFELVTMIKEPTDHQDQADRSDQVVPSNMRIRNTADNADNNDVLRKIRADAWRMYTDPGTLPYYGNMSPEDIKEYLEHPNRTTFVAYRITESDEEEAVGALTICPRNENRIHLETAGVPPKFQRSGIATWLYGFAAKYAYERNPKATLEINTMSSNDRVLHAAKKAGFTIEGSTARMRKSATATPQPTPQQTPQTAPQQAAQPARAEEVESMTPLTLPPSATNP